MAHLPSRKAEMLSIWLLRVVVVVGQVKAQAAGVAAAAAALAGC